MIIQNLSNKEVIINEKTGYLIKPRKVEELESAIMNLSMDKINQEKFGEKDAL